VGVFLAYATRPCDLGLAGQLWTRAGVGDLIAKLYRVRLTEQGVGKYLRRWVLSFQRRGRDGHLPSHSSQVDPTLAIRG
jgi:hypothetical protein